MLRELEWSLLMREVREVDEGKGRKEGHVGGLELFEERE